MTGIKRTSPDSETSTRPSKAAKIDGPGESVQKTSKGGKKASKASIPAKTFLSTALPLHVHLTHTPPTIADPETEAVSVSADPGFIGHVPLIPSMFSTGSFGWKGNKKVMVELQDSEGEEKEKVQVMLSINATVIGSKPKTEASDKTPEDVAEEVNEESLATEPTADAE